MTNNELIDRFERKIDYLRVSVTDRCNLRCTYCTPEEFKPLRREEILTLEETAKIVELASDLGISKVRITGGEPLLRRNLVHLVLMLNNIGAIDDISMTTNGILLKQFAKLLFDSGVKRINVSLDTLKKETYKKITKFDRLDDVLTGIEEALKVGFSPVKLNIVVMKGINDSEILDFAKLTKEKPLSVRFIEHMPLLKPHSYFSLINIRDKLMKLGELIPVSDIKGNGPAVYVKYKDALGSIGIIAPMSKGFCNNCNRLRLTADGRLFPCLMGEEFVDLKDALRKGADEEQMKHIIERAVLLKELSPDNSKGYKKIGKPMASIGG